MGEIFAIERGGSPRPIDEFITDESNGINWIKIGDTKGVIKYISTTKEKIKPSGASRSRMVYDGDFILSNSMSFGKPFIMKTTGCIHDGWLVIRKNETIDNNFLYYILSSPKVFQQFTKLAKGSTVKNLNIEAVKQVELDIPPKALQQAIVSKIEELFSELDKGIEELKTAQQQLKVYRRAVLKWAFEGKLTEGWRQLTKPEATDKCFKQIVNKREQEFFTTLKDSKQQNLATPKRPFNLDPKNEIQEDLIQNLDVTPEWMLVSLVFISDDIPDAIVDGPFGSSINVGEDYKQTGVPVVRMVNIRPYKFIRENLKYIKENKFEELRRHNILAGDILIAKVGATIGDCCIYPFNEPEAMLSTTGSCRIRVDKKVMKEKFLQYYISFQKRTLQNIASQTAQPFLNMKVLKSFPIVLPSLPEQEVIILEIESRLSVCDTIEETITNSMKQAEALRQSILNRAFEGKLI